MTFSYMMKSTAAVVCVILLHCARGVPVQKLVKSSLPGKTPVQKRSAATIEFLMNQDSHSTFSKENSPLTQSAIISRQAFNNDLTCPNQVFTGHNDLVYKRSTCPWYYVDSHDPKRFPAVVLTAKSLCTYAIGSSHTLECSAITHTITVLRQQDKKDQNGNYVWLKDTETVVIGYTATGRRSAKNSEVESTTPASNDAVTPEFAKR